MVGNDSLARNQADSEGGRVWLLPKAFLGPPWVEGGWRGNMDTKGEAGGGDGLGAEWSPCFSLKGSGGILFAV